MKLPVFFATLILATSLLLSGCTSQEATADQVQASNLFVLVGTGARDNTPSVDSLPSRLSEAIEQTLVSQGYFDMAVLDGNVQVLGASMLASQASTVETKNKENSETLQSCMQLILGSQAVEEESDLFSGLQAAANSLHSMPNADQAGSSTLYIVDSCVSTSGILNFADGGMYLWSDPDEVAQYVAAYGTLDLTGIDIVFVYTGEVAGDQPELTDLDKENLKAILSAICENAGAQSVQFASDPITQSETQTTSDLPVCSVAQVSELSAFVEQSEVVLDESNGVSFLVNSAEYRYPEIAQETIQIVAQSIISSGRHVRIVGQCASDGDQAYRLRLSTARAEQVYASLIAAGVLEEYIDEVVGVGTDSEYFVNDLDEQGQLIPALASQNRVVRILYV